MRVLWPGRRGTGRYTTNRAFPPSPDNSELVLSLWGATFSGTQKCLFGDTKNFFGDAKSFFRETKLFG